MVQREDTDLHRGRSAGESGAQDRRASVLGGYLRSQLAALGRRRRGVAWLRGGLWGLALAAGALAFVAWLDLLAALPGLLRMIGVIGAGVSGAVLLFWTLRLARRQAAAERIAKDVDRVAGTGGEVSAALGLAQISPETEGPLGAGLAGMAMTRAVKITGNVPRERIEPLGRAGRAFLGAASLAAAVLLVLIIWPSAVKTELARLADPWGDHPPWSRHVFKLEPGDAKVLYGNALSIRAIAAGAPVEQLDLVVRQPDGSEEAMPMFEEHDRSWRAQLTGIVSPLTYWVRARSARSTRFKIQVINTPQIESVAVRITAPAYTHLPPVEGLMPQGGIAGLPGTEVQITVKSNRPLSRGELELTAAAGTGASARPPSSPPAPAAKQPREGPSQVLTVAPAAGNSNSVTWTFPIRSSGKLSLSVVDEAGERSTAKVSAAVLLLKDERPFVRILAPRTRSFATPDIGLPVEMEAEDDYGIHQLQLYRSLNGTRYQPEALSLPPLEPPRVQGKVLLPLRDYGLAPGDVITLFARVTDNDPETLKGGESSVVSVTIISREMYDDLIRSMKEAEELAAKYEEAARHLESLGVQGDKLRQLASKEQGEQPSPEMRKALVDFANALRDAAAKTERAADKDPLYALDPDLAKPMRELADTLKDAGGQFEGAAKSPSSEGMRNAVERGLQALGRGKDQYAETVQKPLEKFMRAYALLEMEAQFIQLSETQEDLAQRMSNLKGRDGVDDPSLRARMRDLQDQQRDVAADLEALLQEIRNRADELPADNALARLKTTAKAFADAVAQSRALRAMNETTLALHGFQGTEASAKAAEASEVLKKFIKQCCATGAGECAELAFGPSLQGAARQTLGQMLGSRGRGVGYAGVGAGTSGYSMRSSSMRNVGLYGPQTLSARESSQGGRDSATPPASFDLRGGAAAADIKPEDRAAVSTEGAALQGVPPQHRDSVRTYFKRVADETSAGVVLEFVAPPEEGKKP